MGAPHQFPSQFRARVLLSEVGGIGARLRARARTCPEIPERPVMLQHSQLVGHRVLLRRAGSKNLVLHNRLI